MRLVLILPFLVIQGNITRQDRSVRMAHGGGLSSAGFGAFPSSPPSATTTHAMLKLPRRMAKSFRRGDGNTKPAFRSRTRPCRACLRRAALEVVLVAENWVAENRPADFCRCFRSAGDGTRTRTPNTWQGILSPWCLPFHHSGVSEAYYNKSSGILRLAPGRSATKRGSPRPPIRSAQ